MLNQVKLLLGLCLFLYAITVHANEQFELYKRYREGDKAALTELLARSENGDAIAQLWLGNAYYGDKNYTESVMWYAKAAEAGVAGAQNNLGERYMDGEGVTKDYEKAFYWLSKAAEQNIPRAYALLGNLYYQGWGVEKNYEEAANLYRKAAEQGLGSGQQSLAQLLFAGEGVTKDYQEALKWYQKAADQGFSLSMKQIGYIYQEGGFGVIKDTNKAKTWYELAAQKGNASAMNQLGWLYEHGIATEPNIKEALNWYRKGAANNQAAKENLARLEQAAPNPTCNANVPNPHPIPNETAEFYGDCPSGKPTSGIIMWKQSGQAYSMSCVENGNIVKGYECVKTDALSCVENGNIVKGNEYEFDKCSKYFTMIPNYCNSGDYNGQCLNGVPHGVGVKQWQTDGFPTSYMSLNGQFVNGKAHGYLTYKAKKQCGALGCVGGTVGYDAWYKEGEEQFRCLGGEGFEGGFAICSDKTKQAKLHKEESIRRERQERERQERERQEMKQNLAQKTSAWLSGAFNMHPYQPERHDDYATWTASCVAGGEAFVNIEYKWQNRFCWGGTQGGGGCAEGIGLEAALAKGCRGERGE